jgi:hypothetical protein
MVASSIHPIVLLALLSLVAGARGEMETRAILFTREVPVRVGPFHQMRVLEQLSEQRGGKIGKRLEMRLEHGQAMVGEKRTAIRNPPFVGISELFH